MPYYRPNHRGGRERERERERHRHRHSILCLWRERHREREGAEGKTHREKSTQEETNTHTHTHTNKHTHTNIHTHTHTQTNKADCCQFFIAQTTHCNTHVHILGGDTGHTHAGGGRREFDFCIFPSLTVLPPGPQELLSARGPSEVNRPSWSGIDRSGFCCMFFR